MYHYLQTTKLILKEKVKKTFCVILFKQYQKVDYSNSSGSDEHS